MKRIIAVNSNCYHGYTIEEAVAGIRKAGFRYIELTATKGWTEHVFPDMPFERLLAIQDLLRQNELIPFAMSGHCNLMDPERIPDFEKNIRLAAFFGCQYIVSSVGEAHLANKAVADDDEVARRVASLIPMLEENNLILVLETHGKEHGTGEKLARIVRKIGSARVKLNYDTANVIFYGGVNPVQDLKTCLAETAYIPAIFEELKAAGNDSPLSIEIEFTPEGAGSLAAVDQAVADSAAYLTANGFEL